MTTDVTPVIARARRVFWCWRCFLPRRFRHVSWPACDGAMRERVGVFICPNGHVR